jgi:hypothetical protein
MSSVDQCWWSVRLAFEIRRISLTAWESRYDDLGKCTLQRFEFHYTRHPWKLARVLAKNEIGIFQRNALSHRVADEAALRRQVLALESERTSHQCRIAWQFMSRDARVKLQRLYPLLELFSD